MVVWVIETQASHSIDTAKAFRHGHMHAVYGNCPVEDAIARIIRQVDEEHAGQHAREVEFTAYDHRLLRGVDG